MASPGANESGATPFSEEAEPSPRESEADAHAGEGKARVARYKQKQVIWHLI